MYELSQRSKDILGTAHEDLQVLMKAAITNSPYDFGITHGHRTPQEQNELYKKGRTKPGNIVTYVDGYIKKSKHNHLPSLAVDIKCYANGKITWEPSVFVEVGTHIMEVSEDLFEKGEINNRIAWGGNWKKFKDWPHFQI